MPAFGGQGFSSPRPRPPILQATRPTATQPFKPGQAQSIQPPSQGTPYGSPRQGALAPGSAEHLRYMQDSIPQIGSSQAKVEIAKYWDAKKAGQATDQWKSALSSAMSKKASTYNLMAYLNDDYADPQHDWQSFRDATKRRDYMGRVVESQPRTLYFQPQLPRRAKSPGDDLLAQLGWTPPRQ